MRFSHERKRFSLEAHFVHEKESGELAVVGVLFEEGAKKSVVSAIEAVAPSKTGGVRWYVLRSTTTVTAEEVKTFLDRIGANARGPQPLNARMIVH